MDIKQVLTSIGDGTSYLTQKALNFLNDMGILTSPTTAKILTIIIILAILYIVLNVLTSLKKPVKVIIVILGVALLISVGMSFMNN